MPMLTITESCPVHVAHGGNIPLNCFDEATGAFLAVLIESAPVEDIVTLARTWLDQEGNDSATVEYVTDDGSEIFVTYSA